MIIDLDSKKSLEYNLIDPEKVKKVNFIISFSNNVEYQFPGIINIESQKAIIELPELNKMIKDEIEAECHLEVYTNSGKYYKVGKDIINFIHENQNVILDTKFDMSQDKFETSLIPVSSEIPLNMKNVKMKKVKTKRGT